ncbi:MAG: glycosyltransferase family 2 protein [Candidatus Acidiferrum sp.]
MILTPVFNGEEYLRECIESVLNQTYTNWEYLIVNNCSTDRTREIAQEYADRDPRIRLHNNEKFLPLMQNLNNAFRRASIQSKYCKMVLADDWIFPECLEKMVALAEKNPSVGIVGAYGLAGNRVLWHGLPYPSPLVDGRRLAREFLLGAPYVLGSPTSLLFRSECVRSRDPFYEESNPHGDTQACLALFEKCDFGFIHQVLSYTRERPESATSFSRRYNTHLLEDLSSLLLYGPVFLNKGELVRKLNQWQREYYFFLAESVFYLREKAFWRYHSKRLLQLGYPFSRARLAYSLLGALRYTIFHPSRKFPALHHAWAQAWRRFFPR